ncbi:MAG: hypothetical protein V3T16_10005 [Gemmatimonadales bacterium]
MSDAMEMMAILVPLFGLLLVTGTIGYLAYTGVEVVRRRMLGGASPAEEELEELRNRVAELEEHDPAGSDHELIARVAELEERLDFAERLLAKGDMKALPPEATDEVSVP